MNDLKQKLKMRFPAVALLLVTVLFWSFYDRYEVVGPILLEAPVLADAANVRGAVSESASRFVLQVPSAGKRAELRFFLPAATDYKSIRVRARIKVDGVVVGKHSWSCARVIVIQYDANNKWISGPHGLLSEKGTKDWEEHEEVFEIFPRAERVNVVLQQHGTAGIAEFDQMHAEPVRIRASFVRWRILFTGLWLGMAILYFPRCRLHRRRLRILICINVVAILAGTLMPGDWITAGSEKLKRSIQELRTPAPLPEKPLPPKKKNAPPPKKTPAPPARSVQEQLDWFTEVEVEAHQAGHFILFATLCFLVYLSAALERQPAEYFVKVGADILLFAAITEALQFLTIDRTAGLSDLQIDLYGMASALLLFVITLPLVRRFSRKGQFGV